MAEVVGVGAKPFILMWDDHLEAKVPPHLQDLRCGPRYWLKRLVLCFNLLLLALLLNLIPRWAMKRRRAMHDVVGQGDKHNIL